MASGQDSGLSANRFITNKNPGAAQSRPLSHPGLDRQQGAASSAPKSGIVQPKPQALPSKRSGTSSIIVSARQKGNPILSHIKNIPWEYGDIPADYQVGQTACALFLSLKYHRLHPEYIYTRMKALQGKYKLRIILTLVDIDNHEASLKELSKTSVINNVTIILCWSAAEGGRYLELFKSYENASPESIRQHQSTTYADRMVDFVTTPRSVNKTDAVSLVSQFGTIRTAVNARHEDIATIAGWGEKKVQQWCTSVREPFRIERAGKRGIDLERLNLVSTQPISRAPTLSRNPTVAETDLDFPQPDVQPARSPILADGLATEDNQAGPSFESQYEAVADRHDIDDTTSANVGLRGLTEAAASASDVISTQDSRKRKPVEDDLSDGVMAALSKLRKS